MEGINVRIYPLSSMLIMMAGTRFVIQRIPLWDLRTETRPVPTLFTFEVKEADSEIRYPYTVLLRS
jgi:hypothetical protein